MLLQEHFPPQMSLSICDCLVSLQLHFVKNVFFVFKKFSLMTYETAELGK